MEEKQLNFSQPLLSVRRISSISTSQKKKTDTNSNMPPLPSYKSEMISGPITNAGSVPFVWEQIPGRPKSQTSQHIYATSPKLPPGRTLTRKKQDSSVVHFLEEKDDSSKEELDEHNYNSDDGDEAFLDTLTRAESSFYNSSVGGGLSDMKPSKTFAIDHKTRDFMMGRFLPAAKAMASEEPPRRQPMVWDPSRQLNQVVNAKNQPSLRYGPNYVQEYSHENNSKEESDSECDEDEDENTSFKVCGFFPRFASKGSLCLLNPVPGLSQRTKVPISPVTRTMHDSSFSQAGSCNKPEEEPARVAIYEQRPVHGFQAAERPKDKRVTRNESQGNPSQSITQQLEGSTLYYRLQGNGPKLSECTADIANREGFNGYDPPKKGPNSFKELLTKTKSMETESGSLITEKTVYVDIVYKMGSETKDISNLREYDNETLGKSNEGLGENPCVHSLVNDTERLSIPPSGESKVQCNVQGDESNEGAKIEIIKDFDKGTENCSVNSSHSRGKLPSPPPLPKSPSDSWLCRTLPSKIATSQSKPGKRIKHFSNTPSTDPKWENFVTNGESQHKHSQGAFMAALTPIPET